MKVIDLQQPINYFRLLKINGNYFLVTIVQKQNILIYELEQKHQKMVVKDTHQVILPTKALAGFYFCTKTHDGQLLVSLDSSLYKIDIQNSILSNLSENLKINSPILQIEKLSNNNITLILYNGNRYEINRGAAAQIENNDLSADLSFKSKWFFGVKKVIKQKQSGILFNVGVTQILMTNNEYRAIIFSEIVKEESANFKFDSVFPVLYLIK